MKKPGARRARTRAADDDGGGEGRGGPRPRRDGDPLRSHSAPRSGRGAHPRHRDGGVRLGQAHLPVGSLHGGDGPGAARVRTRVLRRDRGVRAGRTAAAPLGRAIRLGGDARHVRALPPVPHGSAPHLREHADPRRARRRMLRAIRRRAGVQRRAARTRRRAAARRRLPRCARQRRAYDAGRRPLRKVRRRPRLRADRRNVRGDRPDLGRLAHRDHGGELAGRRARPPLGQVARRPPRHRARPFAHEGRRRQPARGARRRRRRRARAVRGGAVHQPRARGGPPGSDPLDARPARRASPSRSRTTRTISSSRA